MSIRVVVSHGAALVWRAEDVRVLREEHRVVGSLIGSHPRAPYQNAQLALPLKLLPEEVALLRDRGLATLIDGTFDNSSSAPGERTLNEYTRYKQQQYQDQSQVFQRDRIATEEKFRDKILEGNEKRRERAERKGAEKTGGGAADKPMAEEHMMVQLFHEEPWVSADALADWRYPVTSQERLRYAVFRDLWEKGYYLTSGSKFGGDFLVYPGDPLMYHSYHVAICVPDTRRLTTQELVSMGRLGSNVRKTVLLCSLDGRQEREQGTKREKDRLDEHGMTASHSDKGRVRYLTLEWTGIN